MQTHGNVAHRLLAIDFCLLKQVHIRIETPSRTTYKTRLP